MRDKIIEKLEYAKNVKAYYQDEIIKLEAKIEVYEELLAEPVEEQVEETLEAPVETPTL